MVCLVAALVLQGPGTFGATRYDLGDRVKRLDAAWLAVTDRGKRSKAVEFISTSVAGFFTGRFGDASKALDRASAELEGREPQLRDAVTLRFDPAVVDPSGTVTLEAGWAYDPGAKTPVTIAVSGKQVTLKPGDRATIKFDAKDLGGTEADLSLPVAVDGRQRRLQISSIASFGKRLEAIQASKNPIARGLATGIVEAGRRRETDLPYAEMLRQAEGLDKGSLKPEDLERIDYAEQDSIPMRLAIPTGLQGQATIVIALHGAGASENMFFESYGAGLAVREALKRGWVFVAPRASAAGAAAALTWLKEKRGITPSRVFVMGHSMGGGIALMTGSLTPRPAALTLFAPAARSVGTGLAGTPIFLAVGKQEMGMLVGGVQSLAQSMEGKPGFEFRQYDPCEHLMIVADALPDAYRFLDAHAK